MSLPTPRPWRRHERVRWLLRLAMAVLAAQAAARPAVADEDVLRLPLPFTESAYVAAAPTPTEPLPAPAPEEVLAEPVLVQAPVAQIEISFCEFCGESCGAGECCAGCRDSSRWGRFTRGVYRGLCCPDPCYDPRWRPLADAAFFTSAVRPQSQQRLRWDHAEDMITPDRAEYFWARANGSGPGPSFSGSPSASTGLDYDELKHYSEVAHGAFGASFEYSYRSIDADGRHFAGFGDMTVGTKSLLFDTELVQVAFEFNTHIPQGSSLKGLGTGHVSLEPGMIVGLNLSANSYMQAEFTEWIPLGGTSDYAGPVFRYNMAYNRVIARPHPCVPVIGVLELNGWRFQDGAFTDATGVTVPTGGATFINVASGFRVFFCDRADMGVSYATAGTSRSWTDTLIRTELRFRY